MNLKTSFFSILVLALAIISCDKSNKDTLTDSNTAQVSFEEERKAILQTLQSETTVAFARDYKSWQEKWVHDPTISKTYINFVDDTYSESVGWDEISSFVKTYFKEHPEPEPTPKLVDEINVRLYENAAWVTYEQIDSLRGLKRETRLMEKVNGSWKIAGMHTTIYGPEVSSTNKK